MVESVKIAQAGNNSRLSYLIQKSHNLFLFFYRFRLSAHECWYIKIIRFYLR